MKASILRGLFLLGLFLLGAILPASQAASSSQAPPPGPPDLKMGFGPHDLTSASDMVPVYSLEDEIWVSIAYNQSTTTYVLMPNGSESSAVTTSGSGSVILLHTISLGDPVGIWTLVVKANGVVVASVSFSVVPPGGTNPPEAPKLIDSTVATNRSLSLRFDVVSHNAYDMQGCLLGSTNGEAAVIDLPMAVGNFSLLLSKGNASLTGRFLATPGGGQAPSPFEMWADLLYPYSFSSSLNPQQLITGDQLAASTQTVAFSTVPNGNFSVPLNYYVHLREGRYSLQAYFRNADGLFVKETSVLMLRGGSWLWLGACSSLVRAAATFSVSAPLGLSTINWPKEIFVAYRNNGTEGYAYSEVSTNLTSVDVSVVPWGGGLPAGYSIEITPNDNISSVRDINGTLYVQPNKIPTSFQINALFHGQVIQTSRLNASQKYENLDWSVPLGKLQVAVQLDTNPSPGASVEVFASGNMVDSGRTGSAGTAFFLLPSGVYSVVSSLRNASLSKQVGVSTGQESTLLFPLTSSRDYRIEYELLLAGLAGIAANLWVWAKLPKKSPER